MGSVGHTLICKNYEPPIKGSSMLLTFDFDKPSRIQDAGSASLVEVVRYYSHGRDLWRPSSPLGKHAGG
jgi:hypothetical protein